MSGGSTASNSSKEKQVAQAQPSNSPCSGCYICDGPQRATNFTKQGKLGALISETKGSDSKGPSRVNHLQQLNVVAEKTTATKGMYVHATIKRKEVSDIVDAMPTHNFVVDRMVKALRFQVEGHLSNQRCEL